MATVTSERTVTVDELVAEADAIWLDVNNTEYDVNDTQAVDEVLAKIRTAHPQFSMSYPMVVRYMAQMREYRTRAFRRYLQHLEQNPWKSEDDFIVSQSNYIAKLYKETHPRWDRRAVENLRNNIQTMLRNETATFKNYVDHYNTLAEQREKNQAAAMVQDFKEFVVIAADTMSLAGTFRCVTDLPTGVPEVPRVAPDVPLPASADALLA